jgi:hypothetical protein
MPNARRRFKARRAGLFPPAAPAYDVRPTKELSWITFGSLICATA